MDDADKSGDGTIDLEEFKAAMHRGSEENRRRSSSFGNSSPQQLIKLAAAAAAARKFSVSRSHRSVLPHPDPFFFFSRFFICFLLLSLCFSL
jgi:hypothetical protein